MARSIKVLIGVVVVMLSDGPYLFQQFETRDKFYREWRKVEASFQGSGSGPPLLPVVLKPGDVM